MAPLALDGSKTLHAAQGFRFAVFPRRGGRAPELDKPDTLQWMGPSWAHPCRQHHPLSRALDLDIASFSEDSYAYLLEHRFLPDDLRRLAKRGQTGAGRLRRCYARRHSRIDPPAWRLPRRQRAVDRRRAAAGFQRLPPLGPAIQDYWVDLLSGERADMTQQFGDVLAGYEDFCEFDRREMHLVEALRTLRLSTLSLAGPALGRFGLSTRPSLVPHPALLAGPRILGVRGPGRA
ncbi:MAG: hypothetical protein M5R42_12725 [Rhodocyclaceae bacterium]|nr:hypothetical protein [Rhodocyclaceae bacterium]